MQNNARTFTCMELRQSSSSSTKGSSISRAEASDDVTLAFFRLRWSSWEIDKSTKSITATTVKEMCDVYSMAGDDDVTQCRKYYACCLTSIKNAVSLSKCFSVHLEACVHQDVHVGSAADRSFLTSSFRSWRQQQAAGRRQSGVWRRLNWGPLSTKHTYTESYMEISIQVIHCASMRASLCVCVCVCVCTGLSWWAAADSRWPGRGTTVRYPGKSCLRWPADPGRVAAARHPPCYTPSDWRRSPGSERWQNGKKIRYFSNVY